MNLNELVVKQIINSEKEKINTDFDTRLEKELKLKEKELNDGYKSKVRLMSKELEEKEYFNFQII